ncbi:Malic acid transport protein [Trichoderma lentiforme]|uniref:Malic acid transport protein n=1 Tax=Trichoderma lentiforme TaxID=1567552 RepID=A0A9P4XET4_9HYPO|nr:Malic acid transport protein [Trichoderma lentiforme]
MAHLSPSQAWDGLPTPEIYEPNGRELSRQFVPSENDDVEGGRLESSFSNHTRSFSGDVTRTNTPNPDDEEHAVSEKKHLSNVIDIYDPNRPKLPIRQRLQHFTWAWYTFPMSTGGLSLLIFAQPNQFTGLKTVGLVVYIINIIIFSLITMTMTARFLLHTGELVRSLTHPREGFFFPTFFLSIATIITSTQRYAIPDDHVVLEWVIQAAFWVYVALTSVLAIGQYSYVFAAHHLSLQNFMPTLILPIFPIMLSGTIASVIAATQPEIAAMPILVAGLTCQGLGMSVAILMYAHMIGRLVQSGLPNREHRPGLFMCVGPPSFTALALIGMANGVPDSVEELAIDKSVIKVVAVLVAISLWALSFWWFGIAVVAVISSPPKYFHLGWWAMVFPNTGFTLATISIAKELISSSFQWVTTGMSVCMLVIFCFVLYNHARAVVVQDIMYPGRDENVEDH